MTPILMDKVNRRVLGGFFFIDAITGDPISAPLPVEGGPLTLRVNRSGIYGVFDAPGFSKLTTEFIPTAADWPPTVPRWEISVSDPSLRYLPRRAMVKSPQALDDVLTPQPLTLFPGPSATVEPNWAVIRASVRDTSGNGLPWVFLQALNTDNSVFASGMTDTRGEALLAKAGLGLQISSVATDPVTAATVPVTVKAWFDPSVMTQPKGWVPNPDDIAANLSSASLKTGTQTGAAGARQTLFTQITISV